MEGHPIRGLVVMLALIALDAVLSASGAAFDNVNENTVRRRAEEGDKRSIALLRLYETPNRYLDVINVGLTFSHVLFGIMYASTQYNMIKELFNKVPVLEDIVKTGLAMVLVTIFLVYLVILFGIVIPKSLGKKYSEAFLRLSLGFIYFLMRLFTPLTFLLRKNRNLWLRIFRIKPADLEGNVTEEEIISIVHEGHEQGVLEAGEAEMISNIIGFDNKMAKDIMTHRKRMSAVNSDMSIEEALRFMLKENYSRFPIYKEDIDNIVGILHLKDLMNYYVNPKQRARSLIGVARQTYFVPDTQSIDVLFHDMQLKKIHMAIVVDEYGQTAGLVAMEDILEEIVGDIQDEYDEEERKILIKEDGAYLVKGDALLEEIKETVGIAIDESDMENYSTLNGLLISRLSRIPNDGEQADIRYNGFLFQVVEVSNKMIRFVRITQIEENEEKRNYLDKAEDMTHLSRTEERMLEAAANAALKCHVHP